MTAIPSNSIDEFVTRWISNNYQNAFTIFNNHGINYPNIPTPPTIPSGFSISGIVGQHPTLSWNLNSESDIYKYNIYENTGNGMHLLTSRNHPTNHYIYNGITIGGDRFDPQYCFTVTAVNTSGLESGQSFPRCVNVDAVEKRIVANEKADSLPIEYKLVDSYPNPFNPTTQISYQIPKNSFVNLVVYNALGQEVTKLVSQHQSSGKYTVEFNASNLPSGLYVYQLQAGEFSSTKKMLLTK
ncbi:MAG: T9SS type A sorting domain-containing protein [Melioribacteraceae bacterium]|nr:T9SS type A sorting domain-containing protein [Melioribacteraceae bacterium]